MSFQLNEEHEAIRQAVREFGENEIKPYAREHDEEHRYPEAIRKKAAKQDLVAPYLPEEYGGAGMDPLSSTIVTEELWRADPGIGGSISLAGFGTHMINDYGADWMKEEWLPRIASGEAVCGTAISEAAHGSNIAGMETHAKKEGGDWVLNGSKMWISNGTVADIIVVMAKTDPEARHKGVSAFLVPTDTPGFESHKIDNKLGIRAQDLAELILNDVRIPERNVVGDPKQGFYQLMDFLTKGRIAVGAQGVGVGQASVDESIRYAEERTQFNQTISQFQVIRHKLADMAMKVEAARGLTYRAATASMGDDEVKTRQLASMAKTFASERAVEVADEAIQVFGGAGYVSDHPVERYYRDARITKIYEGTNEIQRNIIARTLLSD